MATNNTSPFLPNPFTPLAFLPPTNAKQLEASIYLHVATLSAFVWDWLMSIPEEIRMCRRKNISPAIVAYFLSRISTLGCCTTAVVFQAASVAHSRSLHIVRAIYFNNKIITIFFGFLLFSIFGSSLIMPIYLDAAHLERTQRCMPNIPNICYTLPSMLNAVFDTSVFVAISLRIASYCIVGDTLSTRIWSFLRGDGLPSLSKSLLQGGQLYYFVTIGSNIAVVVLMNISVPTFFKVMFTIPNLALESAMACLVFRGIRLGLIENTDGSRNVISVFHPAVNKEPPNKPDDFERSGPISIEVTQTTQFREC